MVVTFLKQGRHQWKIRKHEQGRIVHMVVFNIRYENAMFCGFLQVQDCNFENPSKKGNLFDVVFDKNLTT